MVIGQDILKGTFITFSPKLPFANIILSVASSVVYGMSMTHIAGREQIYAGVPRYLSNYLHNLLKPIEIILYAGCCNAFALDGLLEAFLAMFQSNHFWFETLN